MIKFLRVLPTTALTVCVVLAVIFLTAVRFLFIPNPPEALAAPWLTFCGTLAGICSATVVGKRWTSDADVIRAETDAMVRTGTTGTTPILMGDEVP